MSKYGEGFSLEFARAVRQGLIDEPFTTQDVKNFAAMKGWHPSENYLNVVLPNGSSDTHSLNYKKYFQYIENGQYVLSDLGKKA